MEGTRLTNEDILGAYKRTAANLLKDPDSAEDLCNQFTLLHARGKRSTAHLSIARRCAAVAPDKFIAVFNLASAEMKAGHYVESVATFHRALALADPSHVRVTLQHIGLAYYAVGDLGKALEYYERARALKDDAEIQKSIAIARLMGGDLTAMFEFECLYHEPSRKPIAESGIPRWKGEDLTGKTVIVAHEQGYGDTIQFSRFIPELKADRVIWSGPKALDRLMAENFAFSEMIGEDGPFEADYYCSPVSICGALKARYSSVSGAAYLRSDAMKLPGKFKVGLAWAGNPDYAHDHERSMTLEQLAPLIEIPGAQFYALQVGRGEDEITRCGLDGLVGNLGGTLKDWKDTARAVQAMDVIVAIDSAVAHLAGALGKPVLIMPPFANCWRWMLDRTDSPWYASARLFRQFTPGQWAEPVMNVKRELIGMMNG